MIHTCVIVRAKDSNKKILRILVHMRFFFCFLAGSHKINTHLVGNYFYPKKSDHVCIPLPFYVAKNFKAIFFLNHYSQNTFLLGKKFKEYQAFKGTDGCSDS